MVLFDLFHLSQGEVSKLASNNHSRNRSGERTNYDSTNNTSPIKESSGEYEIHNESQLRSPPPISSNKLSPYYLGPEFEDKLINMAKVFNCEQIDILHQAILLYEKVSLSQGKLVLNTNGLKEKISFPYTQE